MGSVDKKATYSGPVDVPEGALLAVKNLSVELVSFLIHSKQTTHTHTRARARAHAHTLTRCPQYVPHSRCFAATTLHHQQKFYQLRGIVATLL